ncbi:hypothetical protein MX850_05215 [Erysipelothrix sp. Poltava]|nr:hypothetical protein MX850_05215 [Erysipelothrix sp. Poltava]
MKKKKIEKVEVRSFSKNTDRVFNVIIGLFALSCIFPFIFVIVVSFTTETNFNGKWLHTLSKRSQFGWV